MLAPMTPPDCDLRDFAYMPLDVLRLRDSDLATLTTGDEFKAAVLLWCAAWHQVPAGSLPNDDRLLARHSGAGAAWKKVRAEAMRGFVLCSDGRLYHPVIAEKALDALQGKDEQRARTVKARVAALEKRIAATADTDEKTHLQTLSQALRVSLSQANKQVSDRVSNRQQTKPVTEVSNRPSAGSVTATKGEGEGEGDKRETETERERDLVSTPSAPKPTPPKSKPSPRPSAKRREPAPSSAAWDAYATAYAMRYGVQPVRNATVNAQLANLVARVGSAEAPSIAAFYVRHNARRYVQSKHQVGLMLHDAEGLRTEWATGNSVTETQARQADRTAATGNTFGKLIDEARNGTDG